MAANASKVRAQYDTDTGVILRAEGTVSTSTEVDTAVSLAELDGAYWHDGEIPHGMFKVEVNVEAINLSTNTYVVSLQVDDTLAQSDSPSTIGAYTVTTVGHYTFLVDSKSIPGLDPVTVGLDKWIAIKTTIAGTPDSPSITYNAWISRNVGA
jgi:hypothetical protein